MSNILHGKEINTISYYEGAVGSTKKEIEVSLFSTKESILKDVIEALAVISNGETHTLEIQVRIDNQNRVRLIKRWTL